MMSSDATITADQDVRFQSTSCLMILILTDHGDVQKPCERRGLFSDLSERGSFSFISRYSSVLTSLAANMSASLADSCRSVASIATPNANSSTRGSPLCHSVPSWKRCTRQRRSADIPVSGGRQSNVIACR